MIILAVVAALLLGGAFTALIRASQRRRAARDAALLAALRERLGNDSLVASDRHLSVEGNRYRLPLRRLLKVARRTDDDAALAAAAVEHMREPLQPLPGSLSLKIHGTRIGVHCVRPLRLDLMGAGSRLARRPEPTLGLTTTYRVDGRADQCVSEAHLQEQAIDTTDLHGIALAVLRQNFDEELVARLLSGSRQVVESQDGSAAALLMALPDFLPTPTRLLVTVEGPDRLVLEPWPEEAPAAPPAGLTLEIDDQGWKVL